MQPNITPRVCVCVCVETMTNTRGLWPPFVRDDAQWAISADRCQRLIKGDAHQPPGLGDGYE